MHSSSRSSDGRSGRELSPFGCNEAEGEVKEFPAILLQTCYVTRTNKNISKVTKTANYRYEYIK